MEKNHHYHVNLVWTGNQGVGTESYTSYGRDYTLQVQGKPDLLGSSDPAFRGDALKWNPEDLLLASLSSCHMLWYLHLCAVNAIKVVAYKDDPCATMVLDQDGLGKFTEATLKPLVTISQGCDQTLAAALHDKAHTYCFIANSVNFAIKLEPTIVFQA